MIALIDMDLVCYRCAASAENDDFAIAVYRMNELLDTILASTDATEYKAFLTGDNNFRKEIYKEYKANRTQERPKHLLAARHYAIKEFNAEAEEALEADDLLGINQTSDTIICSLDKDLLQVPGNHYRWAFGTTKYQKDAEFIHQTELGGLRMFYEQCLKGDRSDNVKGIAGLGDAKAKKILQGMTTEQQMFDKVRELYNNDDEFLLNAQCLWILRHDRESFKDRFDRLSAWPENRMDDIGSNGNIGYTDANIQE